MKRYLVAGFKMTPSAPTFTEARDALLSAMIAQDGQDFAACAKGFAKRGLGFGAVSPDRYSSTNAGAVESYLTGGSLAITAGTLTVNNNRCTDGDAVLDNSETGNVNVTVRNVGVTNLNATLLSLSSSNPHLTFPSGNSAAVPATTPGQSATVSVPVKLAGAVGIEYVTITATASDPGLVTPPATAQGAWTLNADDKANQSATDDVESATTKWTAGSSLPPNEAWMWRRITIAANDHRWLGPDAGGALLTWLQSPPLNVAASGNFSFTFRHRHSFESDASAAYDGGQIQISTNNGSSWTNIGASAVPGYNGTMVNYAGNLNPLVGQAGYVRTNPAYPNFNTVTVSLGATYQGQTVLVRFAIGTDNGGGDAGWEVDDIAFSNITNTPFNVIGPNAYVKPAACGTP